MSALRRHVRWLLPAALVAVGFLLATSRPAAADDCTSRVTGIGDLNDPAAVADCIRTGGRISTTVGVVVAVTAAGIALAGLPRKRTTAPQVPKKGTPPSDPCLQKQFWRQRMSDLASYQQTLGTTITTEFHQYSVQAQALAQLYSEIKTSQYWVGMARYRAAWMTAGGWASLIAATAGVVQAVAAAPAVPGAVAPTTKVLGGLTARTAVVEAGGAALAGAAPPYAPLPYFPEDWGFDTGSDPMAQRLNPLTAGTAEQQRALLDLGQCSDVYLREARSFNERMREWATERQADVNRLADELNSAFRGLRSAYDACPDTPSGVVDSIGEGLRSLTGMLPGPLVGAGDQAAGAGITLHFPQLRADRNELFNTGPWQPFLPNPLR